MGRGNYPTLKTLHPSFENPNDGAAMEDENLKHYSLLSSKCHREALAFPRGGGVKNWPKLADIIKLKTANMNS